MTNITLRTLRIPGYLLSLFVLLIGFITYFIFNETLAANLLAVGAIGIVILDSLHDKRIFYLTLSPVYVLVGQLISLLLVEHGWILIELGGIKSYPIGSILFLALTIILFHFIISLTVKISIFKFDRTCIDKLSGNSFIYYLPIFYLCLVYIPVFIYGSALSVTNGNRVVYNQIISPVFLYLFQIKQFILPIAGLYLLKNKKIFTIYLFAILLWNILIGEKATGIWQSLYPMLLPYVLINYDKIKTKNILIVLGFCIVFITSSIVINYIFIERSGATFIFDRISMQGQLWWYYFNEHVLLAKTPHELSEEFSSEYSGLLNLMYHSMPAHLFNSYIERGVVLTSGFPAIFLFYFGQYWLLPTLLSPFLFGLVVYFFSRSLYSGSILSLLISSKLFFSFTVFFARGDIATFLDYKLFIYLLIIIILQYLPRVKV